MATARIKLTGLDEAINALDPDILPIPTRRLLERAGISTQRSARNFAPKDRGGLRRSIAVEVDSANMPRWAKVGSNLEYAKATELGRPAGIMPPVRPLTVWARRKGMRPRPRIRKDGTPGKMPPPESVGWALAMEIKRRGIEARPYLVPALNEFKPKVPKLLAVYAREIEKVAASRGGM